MLNALSTWARLIKRYWIFDKKKITVYFLIHILYIFLSISINVISVLIPAKIVETLTSGIGVKWVFLLIISLVILSLLKGYMENQYWVSDFIYRMEEMGISIREALDISYEKMEGKVGKDFFDKSGAALYYGNENGIEGFMRKSWLVLESLIIIIVYIIMTRKLPIYFIPLIIIPSIIYGVIRDKYNKLELAMDDKLKDDILDGRYLELTCLSQDGAKDQRLYDFKTLIEQKYDEQINSYISKLKVLWDNYLKSTFMEKTINFVRDIICIYILINVVFTTGKIDDFVLFLGILLNTSRVSNTLVENLVTTFKEGIRVKDYLDLFKYKKYYEGEYTKSIDDGEIEVEFKDVSYNYENGPLILDKLNLRIKKGEKVALVGENGAGKTTLVKLMSGLITPKSGEILINGVNIKDVNPLEVYKRITLVFQEALILAMTLEENISLTTKDKIDNIRLKQVVENAGLNEKVKSLDKGLNTNLTTYLHEDGVELSGGQNQRIMLARALYKGGDLLILDEPTSKLDPIAESKMYKEYLDFSKNKTSIFISHRLSSTNFCDRVIFLEKGKIVEDGTHSELLNNNGQYKKMWDVQSRYYKNEEGLINE